MGLESFTFNSPVTYSRNSGFNLIGVGSAPCKIKDKTGGVWSGTPPACRCD